METVINFVGLGIAIILLTLIYIYIKISKMMKILTNLSIVAISRSLINLSDYEDDNDEIIQKLVDSYMEDNDETNEEDSKYVDEAIKAAIHSINLKDEEESAKD